MWILHSFFFKPFPVAQQYHQYIFPLHTYPLCSYTCCLFIFFRILFYFIFLYNRFLLVISFIHISVYMSNRVAQFVTPPPPSPHRFPPLVSICLFSASVSQFLPCRQVHLYHFSRFHIYALIYDIYFSLSDLLHSV